MHHWTSLGPTNRHRRGARTAYLETFLTHNKTDHTNLDEEEQPTQECPQHEDEEQHEKEDEKRTQDYPLDEDETVSPPAPWLDLPADAHVQTAQVRHYTMPMPDISSSLVAKPCNSSDGDHSPVCISEHSFSRTQPSHAYLCDSALHFIGGHIDSS